MKAKNTARRRQIGFLIFNLALLIAVLGATAVLIVRSDWRYALFDRLRSREAALPSAVEIAADDCRRLTAQAVIAGEEEGVTADRSLLLVNADNPLPEDYSPVLMEFRDTALMVDAAVPEPLEGLLAASNQSTGEKLLLMSTYRDREEQAQVFEEETGLAAKPGTSEHETGLGLDVYVAGKAQRRFIDSKSGVFADREGWKYGFIIRYPALAKSSTGQSYEPWHLRYVGKPHAEIIYRNRMTLESYVTSLTEGAFYRFNAYGISLQKAKDGELLVPAGWTGVTVSPVSGDRYMITGVGWQ